MMKRRVRVYDDKNNTLRHVVNRLNIVKDYVDRNDNEAISREIKRQIMDKKYLIWSDSELRKLFFDKIKP